MHTFAKDGLRVHHNADFSGEAIIRNDATGQEITVPAWALRIFAVSIVCDEVGREIQEIADRLTA